MSGNKNQFFIVYNFVTLNFNNEHLGLSYFDNNFERLQGDQHGYKVSDRFRLEPATKMHEWTSLVQPQRLTVRPEMYINN